MVQQVAVCLRPSGLQRSPSAMSKVSFIPFYKATSSALWQQVGARIPRGETISLSIFTLAFCSACPSPSSLHTLRAQGQNTMF